jgi:hypothetical protein
MPLFNKNKQPRTRKSPAVRSPITTYYRAAGKTDASPFVKKTPKPSRRKYILGFFDIVLLVVLVAGLAYSLMIKPDPMVSLNDDSFHPLSVYQAEAKKQLQQLKNRNKITFSEQSFKNTLQARFPEISAVSIELPIFGEKPKINLSIARPSFQLNTRGTNLIVNNNGIAVSNAAALPKLKKLLTINDQSGYSVKPGSKILSASAVAFINTLIAQCQHAGVPISALTLPQLPQEIDLRASDQPYFVKFYLGGDALTQVGQFLAARAHFKQTGQFPAQYLDVRINGKIFYK